MPTRSRRRRGARAARKSRAPPRGVSADKVGTTLTVAVASPPDIDTLDDFRFASGCEIRTVVALEDEIATALDRYYASATAFRISSSSRPRRSSSNRRLRSAQARTGRSPEAALRAPRDRRRAGASGRIRRGHRAIRGGHRRSPAGARRRRRRERRAPRADQRHLPRPVPRRRHLPGRRRRSSPRWRPRSCSRIKVLSGMDIAEHRLPQDGRFSITVGTRRLDLRSSTYPTMHGEKAVLRLLDRATLRLQLEDHGHARHRARRFRDTDPAARGHDAHDRPDGERQDVDALRRAFGDRRDRQEHHHDRGSGRVRVCTA